MTNEELIKWDGKYNEHYNKIVIYILLDIIF